jgi:hypothetical protein
VKFPGPTRRVLLLIGVGTVAVVVLYLNFGLPLSRLAIPIAVLLAIQIAFDTAMFAVRARYQRTRDLRAGFILAGVHGLFVVLAGMYYAGQLGILGARTFEDNFVTLGLRGRCDLRWSWIPVIPQA